MQTPASRTAGRCLALVVALLAAPALLSAQRALAGSLRSAHDTLAAVAPGVSVDARSVGSSRAVIDSAEIARAAATTLSELIEARAPSVSVFGSGGLLTQRGQLRMRGPTSVVSPALPLLVVDGVRMDAAEDDTLTVQSRLDDIPLADVARVEILRGPAAATLYGAGAASGVIVVTTREAGAHPLRWRATGEASASRSRDDFVDTYHGIGTLTSSGMPTDECGLFVLAGNGCTQTAIERRNLLAPSGFMRTGLGFGSSVEASGGSQATHGRLSVGRRGATGVTADDRASSTSARLDLDQRLISSLDATVHVGFVRGRSQPSRNDDVIGRLLLWRGPADTLGGVRGVVDSLLAIPALVGHLDHLTTGLALAWRPLARVVVHAAASRDRVDERASRPMSDQPFVYSTFDTLTTSRELRETRADVSIAHHVLGADASGWLGIEHQHARATSRSANYASYNGTIGYQISGTERVANTNAVVAAERLAWGERAGLGIGARYERDLLVGDAWRIYPTADGTYRLTSDWHGAAMRLRAAYGEAPQRAIELCSLDPSLSQISSGFGYDVWGPGCNRAPERSREGEIGVDASFRRAAVAVTAFRTVVSGVWLPEGGPGGYVGGPGGYVSRGRIRNQGLELDANGRVIDRAGLRWDVGVTASTLSDRLDTDLPFTGRTWYAGGGAMADGKPVWGGWALPYTFADPDGNGIISADEIQSAVAQPEVVGPSTPKLELALRSTVVLGRGLSLDAILDGRRGFYVADVTDAALCQRQHCLATVALSTPLAEQARALVTAGANLPEDASFWRLREVGARWKLPARAAGAAGAAEGSIVVAGRNLATWTSFRGTDPEIDDNPRQLVSRMVFGGIPLPRQLLFRVELGYGER